MRSDHLFGRVSRRDPRPLPAEAPEAVAPPAAVAEQPVPPAGNQQAEEKQRAA